MKYYVTESLFYNLFDYLNMTDYKLANSVEDLFEYYSKITEICEEYSINTQSCIIKIPSKSTFCKHRKELRENPENINNRIRLNYENILNALIWKKILQKSDKLADRVSKKMNEDILIRNICDVFEKSIGFRRDDVHIVYKISYENIPDFLRKTAHLAVFPQEIENWRNSSKQVEYIPKCLDEGIKIISVFLSAEDASNIRMRNKIKELESAVTKSISKEIFKICIFSYKDKEKKYREIIKNTLNRSSYVVFIADSRLGISAKTLISYLPLNYLEYLKSKPVLFLSSELNKSILEEELEENFHIKEYKDDSEIIFDIARLILTSDIKDKPQVQMYSEHLLLNGVAAVDLSNHSMFQTETLITLRANLAEINEEYEILSFCSNADTIATLNTLDEKRKNISLKIREYEKIICDCQMSLIGFEHGNGVLDELNNQVERCVTSGKYEEAIGILNKKEWKEEYDYAIECKLKSEAVIRTYIYSRRQLISSMRIIREAEQWHSIIEVYEDLLKASIHTAEYELVLYEYMEYLSSIGRHDEAIKLIYSEENRNTVSEAGLYKNKINFLIGKLYYDLGHFSEADTAFNKIDIENIQGNIIDWIEVNVGIAKCLWKSKKFNEMNCILLIISEKISEREYQSPRGRRAVSSVYRLMAIYENNSCFNLEKALKLINTAIEIYSPLYEGEFRSDYIQELEDKLGYAILLNNAAIIYKRLGALEKSGELCETVISIYRNYTEISPSIFLIKLIKEYRNYSMILRKLAKYDRAKAIMYEAMRLMEGVSDHQSDIVKRLRISCLTEMGDIKIEIGEYKEAEDYYTKAREKISGVKTADSFMYDVFLAENHYGLGKIYRCIGETHKAEENYLRAIELWNIYAKEYVAQYLILIAQAYRELALIHEGDEDKKQEYLEMSNRQLKLLSDSARENAEKWIQSSIVRS